MTFQNGVERGDEAGIDLFVRQEALDAEKEQAAKLVVGDWMVEQKESGLGVAEAEKAKEPAERQGERALVEDESVEALTRKSPGFELWVESGDEEAGLAFQEQLEMVGGEGIVLDDANRGPDFFFVGVRSHRC